MLGLLKRTAFAVVVLGATVALGETRLQGGGATFPNPIYQRWVTEYQKAHPDVKIDYQSIGSGGGIKGITEKTFDFAGSDAPMSSKEIAAAQAAGGPVVHLPTVAGAVALAYNIPGFSGDLKLTGPIIADIYLGKITKWNDPAIASINPGAKLPANDITPVYRTDGSGTNYIFTNFLITQSDEFKNKVGAGKQVQWPKGQGGKGSEGVSAAIQGTVGALGYVEMNYATANKIACASLKNKDGNFVKPSTKAISASGAGAVGEMKDSLAVNIWNQPGSDSYPISAFTYIIVYKDLGYLKDEAKARALVDFLTWATTDGQKLAEEMDYAPLAPAVTAKVLEAIKGLNFSGKNVAMSN
ncbi:MAG TPA: phosphate ABC transporter substrate-binding protein PstS [Tepidisphaeraceae bacterium]|jgi:phosphate transport system substrate-binding protein